jgi:ferritin-like metal-binding protein YciE
MALKSMHDLLVEELREMHHAEKQAVRAYPKLLKAFTSEKLSQAVEQHLEETQGQVERLEQIFEELDLRTRGKTCEAMQGLVEDAQDLVDRGMDPELLDAALIPALQKMEHFEIAAYGSAHAHAEALGLGSIAKLLKQSLDEEKATDKKLNDIAIKDVNKTALQLEAGQGGRQSEALDRAAAGEKPKSRRKE